MLLISEVLKAKPQVIPLLRFSSTPSSSSSSDESSSSEKPKDSSMLLGGFDSSKRDPAYAISGEVDIWELSLLNHHYHPSVQAFVRSLSSEESHHRIEYGSDPTVDLSIISFLNRFAYKNPKKKASSSKDADGEADEGASRKQQPAKPKHRHSSSEEDAVPVNSNQFLDSADASVDPDKRFFHKYFADRRNLEESGRLKKRVRAKIQEDYDSDIDDDDSFDDDGGGGKSRRRQEAYEREIDAYADQLADGLMRNADADADIDAISDDDDDDDDDEDGDEDEEGYLPMDDDDEMDEEMAVDDDSDNSSFGGHDLDDFDANGAKGAKKRNHHHDQDDDTDDDYELMEFGDDEEPSTSMPIPHNDKKSKSKGKSKGKVIESDFAAAEDYEEEMENILKEIRESQSYEDAAPTKKDKADKRKKARI
jgi:ribosome biogenesis protein MAK21